MDHGRPNLLLVMADQLAASWLPAYGHPLVQAPNLTALARAGTVFTSAYCPSPLCAPSRSSLLTGRLPSRNGVYDNAAELRASLPTVTHHLRAEGYSTCLVGKMHFVGPDQLHGFEERLTTDIYPADLNWTPDWRLPLTETLPWYHTMESVMQPGVCVTSMQQDYDDEVAFHGVRKLHDLARGGRDRPFFLCVSFTHPHDPWELRGRYWDLYDADSIDLPAVPPIPPADADPHSRRLREMCGATGDDPSDAEVRKARHGYYAAISYLDERIGELLATLRETGLDDETVVIFTTDHGEMLGERGLWYKMSFFEPSSRVPLIVRIPWIGPQRLDDPVSLLDLAPTMLELAGAEPAEAEPDMDGTSLLPSISGAAARRSEPVLAEYLAEGVRAPAVMIRRGVHKFIACPGDPDQLYDVAEDPAELTNLAPDPRHEGLCRQFRDEVRRRWDLDDLGARVLASQRERRLVVRALDKGGFTAWDFEPRADGADRYVRTRTDLYELQRTARLDALEDTERTAP
jgi:choline-sulfatase